MAEEIIHISWGPIIWWLFYILYLIFLIWHYHQQTKDEISKEYDQVQRASKRQMGIWTQVPVTPASGAVWPGSTRSELPVLSPPLQGACVQAMGPAWTLGNWRWAQGWDKAAGVHGSMSQGEKDWKLGKQLPEERNSRGWSVETSGQYGGQHLLPEHRGSQWGAAV